MITTKTILAQKGKQKIVMLTAYDAITAAMAARAKVDIILVGDSLADTALGYPNTLPISLEAMYHHAAAVARASGEALVVFDLPFLADCGDIPRDVERAGHALKACGCHAVKLEGGAYRVPFIQALVERGIPVMGHLGLMPQHVHRYGGMFVQGRGDAAERLLLEAKALEDAGIFALVLECVPEELGGMVSEAIKVPTIGIGAGRSCDGQVQVIADLLGLLDGKLPKHAKRYALLFEQGARAVESYVDDVRSLRFPEESNCFGDQ
ncbi:MAG: 3-methyl-2-oxobutanoate hydroxymethyltransferase [Spirochaetota bacterium]|jgi:3-methyl-2-oxobutanoate hydroxymethyltransferase|nr:3-methyl-2-oxobutanoate hydroxymethyltransferase [Spirochaetota bacterium]